MRVTVKRVDALSGALQRGRAKSVQGREERWHAQQRNEKAGAQFDLRREVQFIETATSGARKTNRPD